MKSKIKAARGFTLIEILVVIGIIAILAAIVIIAINPARQFAQARNSQRTANVNSVLNAIGQNLADNKGNFKCPGTSFSATPVTVAKGGAGDIRPCIVPTYIPELPVDPSSGTNTCSDSTPGDCNTGSYDTGYTVATSTTNRFKVCAPGGQEAAIPGSAAICVER